jgi:hypothetical protein
MVYMRRSPGESCCGVIQTVAITSTENLMATVILD